MKTKKRRGAARKLGLALGVLVVGMVALIAVRKRSPQDTADAREHDARARTRSGARGF